MLVQHALLSANPGYLHACFFVNCKFQVEIPVVASASPHHVDKKSGILEHVKHCLASGRKVVAARDDIHGEMPVIKLLQLAGNLLQPVNGREGSVEKIPRNEDKVNILLNADVNGLQKGLSACLSKPVICPGTDMDIGKMRESHGRTEGRIVL